MLPTFEQVLLLLPSYLESIDDYLTLLSVSRHARSVLLDHLTPPELFRLCYLSKSTHFGPGPWYLLSALSSGVHDWLKIPGSRAIFKSTSRHGPEALLDLVSNTPAIPIAVGWSFDTIRKAHERRYTILNPLTDLIDKCIGAQWYAVDDFWDGGREDAATLYAEPADTLFHLTTWGELFGRGFDHWLEGGQMERGSDVGVRMEWLKYNLPDWHTWLPMRYVAGRHGIVSSYPPSPTDPAPGESSKPSGAVDASQQVASAPNVHPLRAVQAVGPFAAGTDLGQVEHLTALSHLLTRSPLWGRLAKQVRLRCGGDFGTAMVDRPWDWESGKDDWRQDLWESCLWTMGWKGVRLIAEVWEEDAENTIARGCAESRRERGTKHLTAEQSKDVDPKDRLRRMRGLVEKLEKEANRVTLRSERSEGPRGTRVVNTYEFPYLIGDLQVGTSSS